MAIRGYTGSLVHIASRRFGTATYHVLHDIDTQRARIVGHWDPHAETDEHDYRRNTKDQHVLLAMSEEVCLSAECKQNQELLTEPESCGQDREDCDPNSGKCQLGHVPRPTCQTWRVGQLIMPLTTACFHFHQSSTF